MVHVESGRAAEPAWDVGAAPLSIEELMGHFLVGALGLTLRSSSQPASGTRGQDASDGRAKGAAPARGASPREGHSRVCARWQIDVGAVVICGACDYERSQKLNAHVLYLEWTLP